MSALRLKVGCGDYDRTRALFDGTIQAEGIELDWEPAPVPHELFVRVLRGEFDVSEMSLSGLTALIARGRTDLVGLPVFTSRLFRQSFLFINSECGIERPQDLAGRRVGVTDYSITASVWIRGFLQHDYGVAPEQMSWFEGPMDAPGHVVPLARPRSGNLQMQPILKGATLSGMLEAGELDALVCASVPLCFKQRSPRVRRMFPNYQEVEADYFRRTGILPIMHVMVVRRSVYEQNPWVARTFYEAFERSKKYCYRWLEETGAPKTSLVWLQAHFEAERAILGPDPWPYGVEASRPTLEALVTYMHEQGLADRLVPPEELFAEETLTPV
jgi:4,5-dihydroxyphthalate decarboxylase